ncbi:exonuclease VII large subunit [Methylobacterium organophilum]|jgi:exodeoxyribonuclease VII large subunit|uniref:exodeoxyribonuclease VII large subunit n=1 Tax=Methylobacterium organophilum TaxID=410 RepID=UPI0019CF892D|nr:exodeoxyribonuclease VII large subunit [Methylobacterium organophilum]MBN6824003.1 exonuclease VII large subunit [Methylobacterium organophilum]
MRHHLFHAYAPPRPREIISPAAAPPGRPPPPAGGGERVDELRDLFASLRAATRLERVVRAAVVGMEPGERGDAFLMLGERHATAGDPLRLKVRLQPGRYASAEALLNRDVVVRIRTGLRYGFGRGPRVQADVIEVLDVAEEPITAILRRDETVRQIRAEGLPHGPATWCEPQDLRRVVLIASERGEALSDVQRVLSPLVNGGALDIIFVPAIFEGPSAERSLIEAFAQAEAACAVYDAHSITLVVRGGGPPAAFAPLDAPGVARAATRLSNLVTGLGHAATPETALDAIAGRSVATPTAAAVLVRDLLEASAARAERAIGELDAALEERIEVPARSLLARAGREFDAAVDLCLLEAESRLAEIGRGVETGLMGTVAALSSAGRAPRASVELDPVSPCTDPAAAAETHPVLFEATPDGPAFVTAAAALRPGAHLTILLPDGTATVRVEYVTLATPK